MATTSKAEKLAPPVPSEQEKYKMTLEALKSIDEGRVVSHKDASAWMKSLGTDHPLPRPLQ